LKQANRKKPNAKEANRRRQTTTSRLQWLERATVPVHALTQMGTLTLSCGCPSKMQPLPDDAAGVLLGDVSNHGLTPSPLLILPLDLSPLSHGVPSVPGSRPA